MDDGEQAGEGGEDANDGDGVDVQQHFANHADRCSRKHYHKSEEH